MYLLRNHVNSPPGEFFIKQDHAGKSYKFGPSPIITTVARDLSAFRTGNHLPRPDFRSCLEDVDRYTCQRLGGNPRWCQSTEKTYAEVRPPRTGCGACGAKVS